MRDLRDLLVSMRPAQWTKNLIVFTPVIFGGRALDLNSLGRVSAAFVLFCALSGAAYIINDVRDAQVDRVYSRTSLRPIASGRLSARTALNFAWILSVLALLSAWLLAAALALTGAAFLLLHVAYTLALKRVVVLDVLAIVTAFLLRAVAGAQIISVAQSRWLLGCAAFLVLFLALSKRRQELATFDSAAVEHRPVLAAYSLRSLDILIAFAFTATIGSYALYTLIVPAAQGHPEMAFTVPLVLAGLLRYLVLAYSADECYSGEEALLTDLPLMLVILAWLASVMAVLYVR